MEPRLIGRFDERPRLVELQGSILGYHVTDAAQQAVALRESADGGESWGEPREVLALRSEPGRWGGPQTLVDDEGAVHLLLVNDARTGVFAPPDGVRRGPGLPQSERRIDVWHTRSADGRSGWTEPRCIWRGYTGSINGAVQAASGRIVLPFAAYRGRNWKQRSGGPHAFWYTGSSSVTVLYSDDHGESWQEIDSELQVQASTLTTYGAIEPVVIELGDGRLWMLIRTQLGRFYESFSSDGEHWSEPAPSGIVSSDSPAGIVRAADGRLVLLWNQCLRFPYAFGGRHVLHGAVSADEGRSWIGHREVLRDPLRHEPPPAPGDFGTAYPFPVALSDGRVAFTSGQGRGRVVVMALDPQWLCERSQADDFASAEASEAWSTFGCRGAEVEGGLLRVSRPDPEWPSGAVRNFPMGRTGVARLGMELPSAAGAFRFILTDHFSVPFDPEDALHGVFVIHSDGLPRGRRLSVELHWDCAGGRCEVHVDGAAGGTVEALRKAAGVCYLRIRPLAPRDPAGLSVHEAVFETR